MKRDIHGWNVWLIGPEEKEKFEEQEKLINF